MVRPYVPIGILQAANKLPGGVVHGYQDFLLQQAEAQTYRQAHTAQHTMRVLL